MVVRETLETLAKSPGLKTAASSNPVGRRVISHFVAGEEAASAISVTSDLASQGTYATLDRLGPEGAITIDDAATTTLALLDVLAQMEAADVADRADITLRLSDVGLDLPGDGIDIATQNALRIAQEADRVGSMITLDQGDHETIDDTLTVFRALHKQFPQTGVTVAAQYRRTEADLKELVGPDVRIRLVKGGFAEDGEHTWPTEKDTDLAFVRCLKLLMRSEAYPMVGTHDPRLIEITGAVAIRADRKPSSFEYQMFYGVRLDEQRRLASRGDRVRVRVPFGPEWYPFFARRLAERPQNVGLFVKALAARD